jgi:hypothetical protein
VHTTAGKHEINQGKVVMTNLPQKRPTRDGVAAALTERGCLH